MILLKRNQIDDKKWNTCVQNAINPRIYGLTWYLDSVCDNWLGITNEQYDFVFPVPLSKKWGIIPWVAQPPFCQQLGLFAQKPIPYETIFSKLRSFPKVQLHFNPAFPLNLPLKRNSLLNLNAPYEKIYQNYSSLRKRELKKIQKQNIQLKYNENIPQSLNFWINQWKTQHFFQPKWGIILKNLIQNAKKNQRLMLLAAYHNQNIIGTSLFLLDFQRIIYLGGTTNQKGVNTLMFDFIIQNFANKITYLDFEGSCISSIQQFYETWGNLQYEYFFFYQRYGWF